MALRCSVDLHSRESFVVESDSQSRIAVLMTEWLLHHSLLVICQNQAFYLHCQWEHRPSKWIHSMSFQFETICMLEVVYTAQLCSLLHDHCHKYIICKKKKCREKKIRFNTFSIFLFHISIDWIVEIGAFGYETYLQISGLMEEKKQRKKVRLVLIGNCHQP